MGASDTKASEIRTQGPQWCVTLLRSRSKVEGMDMAFSGLHVACLYAGNVQGASLIDTLHWSETMTSAGTTTKSAPKDPQSPYTTARGLTFEISPSADAFVAYGANPDASTGSRLLVRAGETRNVICREGDKVAWIAA